MSISYANLAVPGSKKKKKKKKKRKVKYGMTEQSIYDGNYTYVEEESKIINKDFKSELKPIDEEPKAEETNPFINTSELQKLDVINLKRLSDSSTNLNNTDR